MNRRERQKKRLESRPQAAPAIPPPKEPPPDPVSGRDAHTKRFGIDWAGINWVATGVLLSLFGTVIALGQAFDAHNVAQHAEENTGAQIQITSEATDKTQNHYRFIISDQGEGPANFVRYFCLTKTQGRPWRYTSPEDIRKLIASMPTPTVFRRLTSRGESMLINSNNCPGESVVPGGAPIIIHDEVYFIVEYSTPWHHRYYEDWDLALDYTYHGGWTQHDAGSAAAIYHDTIKTWFESQHAYGEDIQE
jgi:hypothetical protein